MHFTNRISIFIYILSSIIFASTGSSIEGDIRDSKSNTLLIGANIMLDGTTLGTASDENGDYIIKNIPIGSYTLIVMFIGYETMQKQIRIESNEKYIINILLEPSAIKLQETKVTGQKRKEKVTGAPAAMEIISSRDIKGKTTTNMGAYLKGLKGIDFTSSGINNYSISVRGFNSSFNTRLLTLSDGRIANIPALRVINYSTIPQSMEDVDKIEVILGPATALYGANAHSGVVNIISKPPSQSEGLNMSISGSNDKLQLRKINGRFAKKISNTLSFKVSGLYLHAYDWPFISEEEYKSHRYPWTLTPQRTADGKDNNPWDANAQISSLKWDWSIRDNDGDGIYSDSVYVRIGNGEANHGDLDGDGVAGEDWFNGYDDDGDGLIDEDYFTADGIDNNNDGNIDENIDMVYDFAFDGYDNDNNGIIDDEAGSGYIEGDDKQWGKNIDNNLIIKLGRKDSVIAGEINPFYVPNLPYNGQHIMGNHRYNETKVQLEFDIFTYDYGLDGIPGDPFIDNPGDGTFQRGECLWFGNPTGSFWEQYCDCGLDGICPGEEGYTSSDFGEQDGIWQPGDGWLDNNNDGIINQKCISGEICDGYTEFDENSFNGNDVWPLPNGVYDNGTDEIQGDFGQDGIPDTNDPGEDGQLIAWDIGEKDGIFDTGDNLFAFEGEPFFDFGLDGIEAVDLNGDGIYNQEGEIAPDTGEKDQIRQSYEKFTDTNGDNQYNAPDLLDNFQEVLDTNGDGLNDYPDFEIDNRKVEIRIDYDPHPDYNLTFQSGYSWTKTQQVTGTGRFLADGFEYKFYQLRSRYKNLFVQAYMNQSFSGDTRGYNLGNRIIDKSKNYAYQLQHNFNANFVNTKFVWGIDYFRTEPYTYGTILNDGPNGYDNDGDNIIIGYNGIDEDGEYGPDDVICTDGGTQKFREGKLWDCGEGIDEPDEFIDPTSNEYGIYYQSTTELFGTSRYELITATRLDYHDLLKEGIQFAPKLGFIYKPDSKSSMRFTYGKAYNTPNSISLFTDLFIGRNRFSEVYLRGNYKGTEYCRVGYPCLGKDYPTSIATPGFYGEDGETFYTFGPSTNKTNFSGILKEGYSGYSCSNNEISDQESCNQSDHEWVLDESHWEKLPYTYRVNGAPYYFQASGNDLLSGDNIPLDTLRNLIYVPELNGDGVLYSAEESINILDVEPIKTEKIQTFEFGYKGFLGHKTHFTFDYYFSYYEDFFSPPTIITPLIVNRQFDDNGNDITTVDNFGDPVGIMTINDAATYPPYATAFNGIDDDGDWGQWAENFGWDNDDKNRDGDLSDPGEWGFIVYGYNGIDTSYFHPWQVLQNKDGFPAYKPEGIGAHIFDQHGLGYITAGVDEWIEFGALREIETVKGATSSDGEQLPVGLAAAPFHLVLSPMNYGKVWMQGFDMGFTHFLSNKLIIDGNVSWYGTTNFYNELTKKNDPINAPEWKWNSSLKYNSSFGNIIINFRHVDAFKWNDGIWSGTIGPYNIIDLFFTYNITNNLDFNLSALNINDDQHKELVGGAVMGRQIVMRFTSSF